MTAAGMSCQHDMSGANEHACGGKRGNLNISVEEQPNEYSQIASLYYLAGTQSPNEIWTLPDM